MISSMKYELIFIDTNFLIYAHDPRDQKKYSFAKDKLAQWWREDTVPIISIQVLQEFYVTLVRLGIKVKEASKLTELYSNWRVIDNDKTVLKNALQIVERYKISFWDALILSAAIKAGAHEVWTEDLNHAQKFGPLKIVNPFLA